MNFRSLQCRFPLLPILWSKAKMQKFIGKNIPTYSRLLFLGCVHRKACARSQIAGMKE